MRRSMLVFVLMLGLVPAFSLVGCGPADGSGADVVTEDPVETEAPEPAEEETADDAVGTRQNPLPIGTTAKIGDWEVKVTEVNLDADELILATNEFNDPPSEGNRYVLADLEAKYVGDESGDFVWDMMYKFYGSGGNTFDGTDTFAVSPNPIHDAGETFPGASISGDVLYEVPIDQIEGGAIIMEALMLSDTRVFFAVE